jgi:hypothetical protein
MAPLFVLTDSTIMTSSPCLLARHLRSFEPQTACAHFSLVKPACNFYANTIWGECLRFPRKTGTIPWLAVVNWKNLPCTPWTIPAVADFLFIGERDADGGVIVCEIKTPHSSGRECPVVVRNDIPPHSIFRLALEFAVYRHRRNGDEL